MKDEIFGKIRSKAKNSFLNVRESHGWEHTERVYNLALHIAQIEKANLGIVKLAAFLHDIGRDYEDNSNGKICHAEKGAEIARNILEDLDIEVKTISRIVHCIECHRFRKEKPLQLLEAKVLYDADKLDAIGAVGIGRAFLFAGETGAKLHDPNVDTLKTKEYSKDDTAYREFLVKLQKVKDKMQTKEGQRIAEERHNFMVTFFDRINKEVEGNL